MTSTAECLTAPENQASGEVTVRSQRFGTFDVSESRVLHFPQGLIGFGTDRRFVVLDHRPGSPFKWLLSVDNPDLAFAVADPYELVAGYQAPFELATRLLQTEAANIGVFVLVTIPSDPERMTVNLMAPVVVDLHTRQARQIVLEDPRLSPAHLVLQPKTAANE